MSVPAGGPAVRPVALWGLTAEVLANPAVAAHRLTDVEEQRAERFAYPQDRDSFRAAHLLVRVCGSRAGLSPDVLILVQRCRECGGEHGVPRYPDAPHARVSLGHTRGAVIAAVAPAAVGVDIEPTRPLNLADIATVLSPAEAARLQRHPEDAVKLWCRKEAAVKASEVGIAGMAAVDSLAGSTWSETSSEGFHMCIAFETRVKLERVR